MPGVTDNLSAQDGDNSAAVTALPQSTDRSSLGELLLALALTVISLSLHGLNCVNVGGFWRDEANSITISLLPDLGKIWSSLQYDSFPVGHYLAIRGWASLFGSGDTSLRLLGLVIGILLIGSLWLKGAGSRGRWPIVPLLLIGLNPVMIRSLDALRPNGLAALTTVLAFTAVWRALRRTDATRLVLATLALLACAQVLFQSALLILAMGVAAIVTAFLRGGVRRAGLLAVPFAVAALSLLPYAGHLREVAHWAPVAMAMPDAKTLLPGLLKVVRTPLPWMSWFWLLFGGFAMAGMALGLRRTAGSDDPDGERFDRTLYCGLTFLLSSAVFMLFLAKGVGFSPQPWHYLPLLVLLAVAAKPLISRCFEARRRRLVLILLVAGCGLATFYPAAQQLQSRVTSMDLVAPAIAGEVKADDLVVLIPWFNGVSFSRYYHGAAPWMTFPALKESSVHRYDLLKEKMVRPESIAEDLARVTTTLQRGGRVWVVGSAFALQPGTEIAPLPPAPLPGSGWSSVPYLSNWNKLLMATLANRSQGEQLSVNAPFKYGQESPQIMVFQGYRQ